VSFDCKFADLRGQEITQVTMSRLTETRQENLARSCAISDRHS
jgi:hypothetical protein